MTTRPTQVPRRESARSAPCSAVVGLQWGDEGKGKIVDILAAEHDAVVRYNGGANAGHSVVIGGERHALHLVPSGVFHKGKLAVIGNGVVVDPWKLIEEMSLLASKGVDPSGIRVSSRAHVVMPYHQAEDAARESRLAADPAAARIGSRAIGTTRRGIGPAYAEKVQRAAAVRIGDLLHPDRLRDKVELACALHNKSLAEFGGDAVFDPADLTRLALEAGERLRPCIVDSVHLLHDMLAEGRRLLFEGANATLLDVDHGTYPFVTSSSTSALGIGAGSGVPPRRIGRIVGVAKAYCTRVGAGPMPTEQVNNIGDRIRERGREYGTTTGRPRRTGWLDLVALRYAVMLNDCDEIALTLLDVLAGFESLKVCVAYRVNGRATDRFLPDAADLAAVEPVYETLPGFPQEITAVRRREELPDAAQRYISLVEDFAQTPVTMIGVGPDRAQTVMAPAPARA